MSLVSRSHRAAAAMAALQSHRADHRRLSVQCPRSHHVAALYDTGAGLVYTATIGPHSHGSKDFVDTAHHGGRRGTEFADLLDAGPDAEDALPAWCDCGARTVSRRALVHAVDAERRTLRLG